MPLQEVFPEKIGQCPQKYNFKLYAPGESQVPSRHVKIGRYTSGCPPDASGAHQIFQKMLIGWAPVPQSEQM